MCRSPGVDGLQNLGQFFRMAAAALSHVCPAAALALKLLGDKFHQLPRLDPVCQLFCHTGCQCHLVAIHRGKQNDTFTNAGLELVQHIAQGFCIGTFHLSIWRAGLNFS